jgi:lysophospholipase L1-like esterase
MARLHLRHDPGTAAGQKHMVWVGDSMTSAGTASGSNWTRLGDRMARALCTRGVLRFGQGYFTDATSTAPAYYPRGWTRDGTINAEATIHSGTYPDRDDLRANCRALAANYDVVHHLLSAPGDTAGEFTADATYATVGTDWDDPIDWLFVQFVTNDVAEADSPATFQANMEDRLSEWTHVARKFVMLAWVWDGSGGLTFPNEAVTRSAYHEAAINAAGAVGAGGGSGYLQPNGIPVINVSMGFAGLLASPGSANNWSSDGVHLTPAGVELFVARWGRRGNTVGLMRP